VTLVGGGVPGPDVSTADAEVARPQYLGKEELDRIFSVEEFEPLAEQRMHPSTYAYVRGWAGSGWTVENNIRAFRRWVFRPRVLVDVSVVDTSTTVLGQPVSVPVLFAPTSIHKLSHPDGEVATARAASALQTLQVLSTGSSATIEEIAEIGPQRWFQLYWYSDRGITRELIERARAADYSAIVLTVDAAIFGWREGEKRVTLVKPDEAWAVNLPRDTSGLANDMTLTWRSLEWLREASPLPIVLKGIVRADDTRLAAEHGVDAVIVSNHGGRQADGAVATLDALPRVAEAAAAVRIGRPGAGTAAGGRRPMEVYVDGGVRRGTDVLKALALGARAVLIGRPVQWGLAAGGEAGVVRMMELISGEFRSAMGLVGVRSVHEITRAVVAPNPDPRLRYG
jgi:4-hydroxymandelate oxidase